MEDTEREDDPAAVALVITQRQRQLLHPMDGAYATYLIRKRKQSTTILGGPVACIGCTQDPEFRRSEHPDSQISSPFDFFSEETILKGQVRDDWNNS